MQRILRTVAPAAVLLALTACAEPIYQQQYAVQQPQTLTQMQGQCFSNFKQFDAQTNCISNALAATGIAPDSGIQEYMLLMQSLQEKVARKTLSASDARLKLAGKLNEMKAIQDREDAIQQQLENQRAAHNAEVLRQFQHQYKAPQLEMPTVRRLPSPINTNCQASGNQVNCTSH